MVVVVIFHIIFKNKIKWLYVNFSEIVCTKGSETIYTTHQMVFCTYGVLIKKLDLCKMP